VYGAVNFAAKMKGTAIVEAGLASKIIWLQRHVQLCSKLLVDKSLRDLDQAAWGAGSSSEFFKGVK
jgi:hypothetical protein